MFIGFGFVIKIVGYKYNWIKILWYKLYLYGTHSSEGRMRSHNNHYLDKYTIFFMRGKIFNYLYYFIFHGKGKFCFTMHLPSWVSVGDLILKLKQENGNIKYKNKFKLYEYLYINYNTKTF